MLVAYQREARSALHLLAGYVCILSPGFHHTTCAHNLATPAMLALQQHPTLGINYLLCCTLLCATGTFTVPQLKKKHAYQIRVRIAAPGHTAVNSSLNRSTLLPACTSFVAPYKSVKTRCSRHEGELLGISPRSSHCSQPGPVKTAGASQLGRENLQATGASCSGIGYH